MPQVFRLPLSCGQVVRRLGDHLDQSLPERVQQAVSLHVVGCQDCQNYLRGYLNAINASRRSFRGQRSTRKLPQGLVARILASRPCK